MQYICCIKLNEVGSLLLWKLIHVHGHYNVLEEVRDSDDVWHTHQFQLVG